MLIGYCPYRTRNSCSWFIKSLCDKLDEKGKEENILILLAYVCQQVAIDYQSNSSTDIIKQIPCFTSLLTRILKFTPKWMSTVWSEIESYLLINFKENITLKNSFSNIAKIAFYFSFPKAVRKWVLLLNVSIDHVVIHHFLLK